MVFSRACALTRGLSRRSSMQQWSHQVRMARTRLRSAGRVQSGRRSFAKQERRRVRDKLGGNSRDDQSARGASRTFRRHGHLKISVIRHLNSQAQLESARRSWQVFRNRLEKHGLKRSKSGLRPRTNYFETTVGILSVGIRAVGLWVGVRNASRIRLVRHEIPIMGLPARFDGYRNPASERLSHRPDAVACRSNECRPGRRRNGPCDPDGRLPGHYGRTTLIWSSRFRGSRRDTIARRYRRYPGKPRLRKYGGQPVVGRRYHAGQRDHRPSPRWRRNLHHRYRRRSSLLVAGRAASAKQLRLDRVRIALVHTSELAADAAALGYSLYLTGTRTAGKYACRVAFRSSPWGCVANTRPASGKSGP